jgi:hypothetical protein
VILNFLFSNQWSFLWYSFWIIQNKYHFEVIQIIFSLISLIRLWNLFPIGFNRKRFSTQMWWKFIEKKNFEINDNKNYCYNDRRFLKEKWSTIIENYWINQIISFWITYSFFNSYRNIIHIQKEIFSNNLQW